MIASLRKNRAKTVKLILVAVIVLIAGILVAIFVGYRKLSDTPNLLLDAIRDNADITLGTIRHTATRDGVKEWMLEAKSARVMGPEKLVILKDLSVVYYLEDGREAYLTAGEGILNTGSNDIEVSGNVVLISEPYELQTDKLNYRHQGRTVSTDRPVRLISLTSYLSADSMSFDFNTRTIAFNGSVEGIFAEKIKL